MATAIGLGVKEYTFETPPIPDSLQMVKTTLGGDNDTCEKIEGFVED